MNSRAKARLAARRWAAAFYIHKARRLAPKAQPWLVCVLAADLAGNDSGPVYATIRDVACRFTPIGIRWS